METKIAGFTIFTILGATGDLVDKKIIPSLYSLFTRGIISISSIKIIALARRDFTAGKYKEIIDHSLETYGYIDISKVDLTEFYSIFEYHQGQFDKKEDFISLADKINDIQEKKGICAHKTFYLAIPTDLYEEVISHIQDTQLQDLCSKAPDIYSQLIIEKPFGKNFETSRKLDASLKMIFKEEQIYRIDHYMGKSIVNEIIQFRKKHLTEKWNKDFIKSVSISTVESLGVEKRGAFFDSVGSLVDVGQNHLVELAAILTMDLSEKEDSDYQRNRTAMLGKLRPFDNEEIKKYTYRAQYKGYQSIENVRPDSQMETYFKIVAFFEDKDWQNVPFYLESGKRCGPTKKEIIVQFIDGGKVIFEFVDQPKITINDEEIPLHHADGKSLQYVGEYATLFEQALKMQRENFISIDEVNASWNYIDPIRKAWDESLVPLDTYTPDDRSILLKAHFKI